MGAQALDIRSLRLFIALAGTRHFGRAGEQMHLSLSSVSRTVQKLEAAVGQRLFERDNRHVELTAAGQRFLSYAQSAIAEWDGLLEEYRGEEALVGEISLFSSVTATHAIISPIVEQFRQQHPRIELKIHTGDQADAIDRVLRGQDDLAIAARGAELPADVEFSVLQYSPLQFIVPTTRCAVADMLVNVDKIDRDLDWGRLPLVVAERGLARARLLSWLEEQGAQASIYAQVAGHEAIVSMVALGMGVGVVPGLVTENSPFQDQVRVIDMSPALEDFSVGICARSNRLDYPLVAAFWNSARASYPSGF